MLTQLAQIAREAGGLILEHSSSAARTKEDGSPVTDADVLAGDLIVKRLKSLDPGALVICEESDVPPPEEMRRVERFWLVDPLDGTKEFLQGRDDFTVNIALIVAGVPRLGAVFAPRRDLLYLAAEGEGSFRQAGGGALERVFSRESDRDSELVVVESRSHPSRELEEFLRGLKIRSRIQIGSSLKLCLVADGTADIYPRFGPTMEWDVAAGDCVFRYSGRKAPRRSPLAYNKPGLRNGNFVLGF
jgi:3'(2'), 5'-bisphosphate nucleotidase